MTGPLVRVPANVYQLGDGDRVQDRKTKALGTVAETDPVKYRVWVAWDVKGSAPYYVTIHRLWRLVPDGAGS